MKASGPRSFAAVALVAACAAMTSSLAAEPVPTSPAPAATAASASNAPLQPFSEAATKTGALYFKLGDRFTGPGVVTIGWLGSKKQVVLPPGDWIVLAAADHDSTGSVSAQLVTVVFGQFDGRRLATALRVTANRRGASAVHRWNDVEACRASALGHRLHRWASAPGDALEACVEVLKPGAMKIDEQGTVAADWAAHLARMGAVAGGPTLTSRLYFTDSSDGYLRIIRTDWRADVVEARDPGRLVEWLDVYRTVAAKGFQKTVQLDDPTPQSPGVPSPTPPDSALDPAALLPLLRP
jgi:hypothetical protein